MICLKKSMKLRTITIKSSKTSSPSSNSSGLRRVNTHTPSRPIFFKFSLQCSTLQNSKIKNHLPVWPHSLRILRILAKPWWNKSACWRPQWQQTPKTPFPTSKNKGSSWRWLNASTTFRSSEKKSATCAAITTVHRSRTGTSSYKSH